jgi:signal transduction histidine kinase
MNSTATVLLVDDRPENLVALEAVLEPLEIHIEKASDANSALRFLLDHEVALILLDVEMPDIDGLQTAQLIRERPRSANTPIIFITAGNADAGRIREAYKLGAVDYITKPIDRDIVRWKASVFVQLYQSRQQERLLAEEHASRLHAEAANRAKDQFLAIVSHELRTPLVAIIGWSNILLSKKLEPDAMQRALNTIQRNATLQHRLVSDILDFSGSARLPLDFMDVDVKQLVEQCLDTMKPQASEKGIKLLGHFSKGQVFVEGDPLRLQQLITNLLSNAVKFTPDNGTVTLTLTPTGDSIRLSVKDTGIGIEPEFLSRIFEPFVQADSSNTRAYSGLGLGLAIVRQLAELHKGQIQVTSEGRGKGAAFTLTLPVKVRNSVAS